MNRKKRNILIISYASLLCLAGFFLIFVVSRSKLATQIEVFENTELGTKARWNALAKIAAYDEKAVSDTLTDALQDTDPYIRMLSAQLCEKRKEYRAIPLLIQNLKDNTKIMHPKAGRTLPMVKISAYKALKGITGRDFGSIEESPLEVAQTIRRWELWWFRNAGKYGMEIGSIKPDYETAILSSQIDISRRLELLIEAENEGYPGLEDIVIQILARNKFSLLKRRAIILAGRYRMKEAIPLLAEQVADPTMMEARPGVDAPLIAMWANASLVQITGYDPGPVYNGMTPEQQKEHAEKWKLYAASAMQKENVDS